MGIFTILSLVALFYWAYVLIQNPERWMQYVQFVPVVFFMLFAQAKGLTHEAWVQAFMFSGICGLIAIIFSIFQRIIMDRLFLGLNFFLLLGGLGFAFNIPQIMKWYSATNSGPFFSCIAVIGLITTLFTPTGFLGKKDLSKDAVRYGSFILLAATFIALIWSIQQDAQGILWAVIAPFGVLSFIQYQMRQHIR